MWKKMMMLSLRLSWTCQRDSVSLLVKFGLNKNNCKMMSLSLSLNWTCQRDGVSLIAKFGINKNNFV